MPNNQSHLSSEASPIGFCACGCGRPTKIVAGKYLKYANGTHNPNYKSKREPPRQRPKPLPPQPLRSRIPSLPPVPKPPTQSRGSNAEVETQDRLGPMIRRLQADQDYVTMSRLWLAAEKTARHRNYMAERRKVDLAFRLLCNLRGRVGAALKGKGKSKRTMRLLGCSISELKGHLEKQFTPGMSWSNYGQWHIDHIIPCCSFDFHNHEQQRACFHFSNLQPLWAMDNFKKSGIHPGTGPAK